MARDRPYRQSLGVGLSTAVKKSRVLLVGAGGIGCELLKNLVMSGFGEVHIVDLDTIDLSNLNRQFLFRHEHIKKPKAVVAKEMAGRFNPTVKIEAHLANIKDREFDVAWYKSFDIVFNALDNLDARRHVNRMCLLADVPLIESGTTGFKGQVQPIRKTATECYDCNEKEIPKSFPVCTIRSTPSMPIHCIVWAKSYLFAEVFGKSEDEVTFDTSEDDENAEELANLKQEALALSRIRKSMGTEDFCRLVFEKVFTEDIRRLQTMEDMWKSRKMPNALSYSDMKERVKELGAAVAKEDQRAWSLEESFAVFSDSLQRLSARGTTAQISKSEGNVSAVLNFDKDDEDTLDFVTASANLRSFIFHIEPKSKFDVKQMAGNIIPAIATTNAMTAGLCVLEAFKMLRGHLNKAKLLFLEAGGQQRAFASEALRSPNPNCAACSQASASLNIDCKRATIQDLLELILKEKLGYGDEISIRKDSTILFDPDFEDNLTKKLIELEVGSGQVLTISDEDPDDPRVDLSVILSDKSFKSDVSPLELSKTPDIGRKARSANLPAADGVNLEADAQVALKRKREGDGVSGTEGNAKRTKANGSAMNGDDLVLVNDAVDGPIILDD